KPTLRLGVLNGARGRSELAIQISDDLFVVRFRSAVVISGTRVVVSDDLRIVSLRLTVVVVDGFLIRAVDSVNFAVDFLLRPTLGFPHLAVDLLLHPTLGFPHLAVKFIGVESCHYLAPYRDRTSLWVTIYIPA